MATSKRLRIRHVNDLCSDGACGHDVCNQSRYVACGCTCDKCGALIGYDCEVIATDDAYGVDFTHVKCVNA